MVDLTGINSNHTQCAAACLDRQEDYRSESLLDEVGYCSRVIGVIVYYYVLSRTGGLKHQSSRPWYLRGLHKLPSSHTGQKTQTFVLFIDHPKGYCIGFHYLRQLFQEGLQFCVEIRGAT